MLEGYTPHLLRDRISVTMAEAALAELHGDLERTARRSFRDLAATPLVDDVDGLLERATARSG